MKFEWDENKNKANKNKHGISFELSSLAFHDPYIVSIEDHRHEEERWQSLGLINDVVIYLAHIIEEEDNGEEIIRIISARKATASEERRYYFNRQNEM